MNRSPDIIVVGGGVIGCAAAYYTAKRGLRVTLRRTAMAGGWPLCGGRWAGARSAKT